MNFLSAVLASALECFCSDPNAVFPHEFRHAYATPLTQATVTQQDAFFTSTITTFDAFARATAESHSSTLGYSRSSTQTFEDRLTNWVIGLPLVRKVNTITESETTYNTAALPATQKRFGELTASYTYNADGTIATISDGRTNVTTLSEWKRGLPQRIDFADASFKAATICCRALKIDQDFWFMRVEN
jgi:hypothetical protein